MTTFAHLWWMSAPLFLIIATGYLIAKIFHMPEIWVSRMISVCYFVLLPMLLFRLMTTVGAMPKVDSRLLLAFFGGCLIVFFLGRIVGFKLFRLDAVSQSVFALGGVFSNNVLLGLPLAKLLLGDEALPSVALVLVFNALILWTLVTASVEWAKNGAISLLGFKRTAASVARNPIVIAIGSGAAYGLVVGTLPKFIGQPLTLISEATVPLVLFALGASLANYVVSDAWRESLAICALKLLVQPLVVYILARLLNLAPMETRVVVLLASIAVGVNVYMMARQFNTLQVAVASSLVLSTVLATFTVPLLLAMIGI